MTSSAKAESPELKPCPFCGHDTVTLRTGAPEYYVTCAWCGASSDTTSDPNRAIDKWNRRAPAAPRDGEPMEYRAHGERDILDNDGPARPAPEALVEMLRNDQPTVSKTGSDVVLSFACGTYAAQALSLICETIATPPARKATDEGEKR